MAASASIKKTQSITNLLINSFELMKQNLANLVLTIFFVLCLVIVSTLVLFATYYLFIILGIVKINIIFTYNLIWKTSSSILLFILASIAQIWIINVFFNPTIHFKENLKSAKKYFVNFLLLSIILYVLFVFFSLPVYVGIILMALNNTILGLLSFFLGIVLASLLVSYLVFSPFVLIDKNIGPIQAIKESITVSKNYLANIILKILILIIILALINIVSTSLTPFYALGKMYYILGLIGILLAVIMILLAFAYLFAMYQNFKKLNNA